MEFMPDYEEETWPLWRGGLAIMERRVGHYEEETLPLCQVMETSRSEGEDERDGV